MKNLAPILLASLLAFLFALPAFAADGDGMTFSANTLYSLSGTLEKAPLTFEAVIRVPKGYTDRAGMIISSYAGNNKTGITLQFNSGKELELYYELANGKTVRHKFTSVPITSVATGEWTHITVVKDDAAGKAHAYINGEFKQTAAAATQPYGYFTSGVTPTAICIGGDHRGGNSQYFKAEIREIAMYSDVRTADEIKEDFEGIRKENDNLLVWHKLSADTTSSTDLSGNGYDMKPYTSQVTWLKNKKPVTDYAYSFAVVGDTQYIASYNPDNMPKYYQWIADNIEEKKIECVIGLGDITDANQTEQWNAAKNGISLLDDKILYTLVRGNHDNADSMNRYLGTEAYYNQLKSRGESGVYQEGKMENAYCTFTVGKTDYLILMLDFGAKDDVLEWAGSVLEKYPQHRAIITTHGYMFYDKTTLSAGDKWIPSSYDSSFNDGDDMWKKCFSKYENVCLVLSGHVIYDDIVTRQENAESSNRVTQMLINPQSLDKKHRDLGGLGMIAMFYFNEDGTQVDVEYYSIFHDEYFGSVNQLELALFNKKAAPAETTAPETTAAPVTTAPAPETTAVPETTAPETTAAVDIAPKEDRSSALWIVLGIAAAAAAAVGAVIAIRKKSSD